LIKHSAISLEGLGHLNYLHALLTQPVGSWEGFYRALSPSMNFALRYQLAFSTYALAAMAQRTPAYRTPYVEAMRGAIEKMLHVDTWGYWRVPQEEEAGIASAGHVAVLVSPHRRGPAGPPSDPIARDNLQYSGHLSTMLGLYEKVSGDSRYDEPFTLSDPESGVSYTYTHSAVAERIHAQQQRNSFGGVCCEQGMAYVPCNNHALASNTLHDALHGTQYRRDNARWLKTVRSKMVLKGPALRGVFGTAYMKDFKMATPVAFNFTDAWGLAFMLPFDRGLVRKLYGKFKKRGVVHAGADGAYIGSSPMSERTEISDVPINTGFGLVLARGMGDTGLARELARYAASAFDAGWDGNRYFYRGAPRTMHATTLFALASAIEPGGADFERLFNSPPEGRPDEPHLAEVETSDGSVGVAAAEYDPEQRTLHLELCQVPRRSGSETGELSRAVLTLAGLPSACTISVGSDMLLAEAVRRSADGSVRLEVLVEPSRSAYVEVTGT
jgi:hypothetical protein